MMIKNSLVIKRTENVSSDWAKNNCWVLTDNAAGWIRIRRIYKIEELLKIIAFWTGCIRIHK